MLSFAGTADSGRTMAGERLPVTSASVWECSSSYSLAPVQTKHLFPPYRHDLIPMESYRLPRSTALPMYNLLETSSAKSIGKRTFV